MLAGRYGRCGSGFGPLAPELRCGRSRVSSSRADAAFATPQWALVYLVAGDGRFTPAGGAERPLRPGDVFQRLPRRVHALRFDGPSDYCWVALPAPVREALRLLRAPCLDDEVFHVGVDRGLPARFERLAARVAAVAPGGEAALAVEALALAVELLGRGARVGDAAPDARIVRACALLDADGRLPLRAVAERVGMGYASFRKRFRRDTGLSPGGYRIRRRIDRAAELLRSSDDSVQDIAERLGYPDLFSFSAQFKRVTGRSPSRYRAEIGT